MAYGLPTTLPQFCAHKKTFQSDLERAFVLENQLKDWFIKNYHCVVKTFHGNEVFTDYDLLVQFNDGREDVAVEVKEDKCASTTGNIAIEVGRMVNGNMKDTCLSISKADLYAYYFRGAFHLIATTTLKQLVKSKHAVMKWGGSGKRAVIAIIKEKVLLRHVIKSFEI
jgi:hypothetical protein